jgi:hypothetical protein
MVITLALGQCWLAAPASAALIEYDLTGKAGSEISDPATFVATGLTALDLSRGSGVIPIAGANSLNSSGWDDLSQNDFVTFGFNLINGYTAMVSQLTLALRSSGTGPGFMNLLYSADGGPETLLTTLTMPNAQFLDENLTFAPVSVTTSFRVFLRAANTTSASGGVIGSAGTFRVGDYSPNAGASFLPVTIDGSTSVTATPEPSTTILGALGITMLCLLRSTFSRKSPSYSRSNVGQDAILRPIANRPLPGQ